MAGAFRCRRGGILSLLSLPREEWEAIEARLLTLGFVLADVPERVTWRALLALLRNPWTDAEYIAAYSADLLAWLRWAKTEDAQHDRNHPEPLPRPGEAPRASLADEVRQSIEQAQAIWGG